MPEKEHLASTLYAMFANFAGKTACISSEEKINLSSLPVFYRSKIQAVALFLVPFTWELG